MQQTWAVLFQAILAQLQRPVTRSQLPQQPLPLLLSQEPTAELGLLQRSHSHSKISNETLVVQISGEDASHLRLIRFVRRVRAGGVEWRIRLRGVAPLRALVPLRDLPEFGPLNVCPLKL